MHANLATKKNENVDERILQVDGYHKIAYIDETATVEIIFAPAVVPLITRLRNSLASTILSRLVVYLVPMLFVCMNY